jgi:hypothetical protein
MLVETRFRTRRTVFGLALAILIGLLGLAPIVVWNVQHGWVGLRHVAGQAGLAGGPRVDLAGIIKYIGGQLGVVGLVWLPAMAWALVELWRRPEPGDDERHDSASLRLLLCATAVPFVAFLVFSPITKVQPNWPVLGLLPGLIVPRGNGLCGGWLSRACCSAFLLSWSAIIPSGLRRCSAGWLAARRRFGSRGQRRRGS